MYEDNRGQEFLKVTGILMILCGAASLIFSGLGLLGIGFLDANVSTAATILERLFIIALIATCISCLVWIVGGVFGALFCENTEKAYLCVIFGSIALFFSLAVTALHICSNGIGWLTIVGLLIALVLNGYYLYGAILRFLAREKDEEEKQNKKELKEEKKRNKEALKALKKKGSNAVA